MRLGVCVILFERCVSLVHIGMFRGSSRGFALIGVLIVGSGLADFEEGRDFGWWGICGGVISMVRCLRFSF